MKPGRSTQPRRVQARANAAPAAAAARPGVPPRPGRTRSTLLWALGGALALLPLLWASRGPTLGVPFADDYNFLARLASGQPLDLFGPMAPPFYYWRPVSRQLYFLLVGPWLLQTPWMATLFAAVSLVALYALLFRIARRFLPAPSAAALACFPLLAEPARVLLAWPSATQHLLAAVFAALAVERAAAGRLILSATAALLALLSNEAAFVVLPTLPLVAGFRSRSKREALRWGAATLAVAALWAAGYAIARHHGTGFPESAGAGFRPLAYLAVLAQSLVAQMGWEDLATAWQVPLVALAGLLIVAGVVCSFTRAARRRLAGAAPVLLGGLAWFLAGLVPLAFLSPDWNSWRTPVAALGLAVALGGWLALAAPPLAAALVALRLAALLLAHPAPAVVSEFPAPSVSSLSFARIVRLQRLVHSTHEAMMTHVPQLPRGGTVRYWNLPRIAEMGFADGCALRVWYGDSTLAWTAFGGEGGRTAPRDALVEYNVGRPWPATVIDSRAAALCFAAYDSTLTGSWRVADSLLVLARRIQPGEDLTFFSVIDLTRAQVALRAGNYVRADSLLQASIRLSGPTGTYWMLTAVIAQRRGDRSTAADAVRKCLALDPRDADGLRLAKDLGIAPPAP